MNANRLIRLAYHLISGELGHNKFDFSIWNDAAPNENPTMNGMNCGYSGCAIGELPILFPLEWKFTNALPPDQMEDRSEEGHFRNEHENYSEDYVPLLRNESTGATLADACQFFEIPITIGHFLFVPREKTAPWNKEPLGDCSTKEEVAAGIMNYVMYVTGIHEDKEKRLCDYLQKLHYSETYTGRFLDTASYKVTDEEIREFATVQSEEVYHD